MTDAPKDDALAVGSGSGRRKAQHSNDSADQRRRLLDGLRRGPVTTIQARRDLDIMMPAARVFELRARGYAIVTYWAHEPTECGRLHTVARYALLSAANDGDGSQEPAAPRAPQDAA